MVEVGPGHDGLRDEGLALAAEAVVHEVAVQQDSVHEEVAKKVQYITFEMVSIYDVHKIV